MKWISVGEGFRAREKGHVLTGIHRSEDLEHAWPLQAPVYKEFTRLSNYAIRLLIGKDQTLLHEVTLISIGFNRSVDLCMLNH